MELVKEKWMSKVGVFTIGATKQEGGSRIKKICVGGEETLPFLHFEGKMPYAPVIAGEIQDMAPDDWPEALISPFKDVLDDPGKWARKYEKECGVDLICLKFAGAHPDNKDTKAADCAKVVKDVLAATSLPLVIIGCGNDEKDNEIIPAISEAAKGENVLLGKATQDNYKTIVACASADGHSVIAESPIDINIAKQVNVLISDLQFSLDKIIIDPTTGGLGYGLEYCYSIMERARIGALGGDRMLGMPFIVFPGQEAWRSKEAKTKAEQVPSWGDEKQRGPMWETITAVSLLLAGADVLVMRHPRAIEATGKMIKSLMKQGGK